MDKFPQAFRRFEKVVDVGKIKSFQQLLTAFSLWAGRKWKDTPKQRLALEVEAVRLGLLPPVPLEKFEEQKRKVDRLYRRVYYTYRRLSYFDKQLETWNEYFLRMMKKAVQERWSEKAISDFQKRVLPRIRRIEQRREKWFRAWSEAYGLLRTERDILKAMERQLEEWRKRRRG